MFWTGIRFSKQQSDLVTKDRDMSKWLAARSQNEKKLKSWYPDNISCAGQSGRLPALWGLRDSHRQPEGLSMGATVNTN